MRLPSPHRRPRRLLATLALPAVVALALTGCSGGAIGTADAATGTPAPSIEATSHLVEHARGETEVPDDPQRVVVLEPVQLDTTVALGVIPVGAAVLNEAAGVPAYLGAAATKIATVGTVPEPSIEKIAALKPDLILGTESRHSALYEQLATIAPTVFMATQTDPWPENVALVARALGDEAGADQLLADYTDRCDEIAATYDTAGMTAQFVRPREGILTLYGPTSFAGSTLECAGFTIPERDWEESISVDISPERVLEAEADIVLVSATDVTDVSQIPESIRGNATAFPGLNVVDQSFWITGVGPLGGMTVLDDIERILAAAE